MDLGLRGWGRGLSFESWIWLGQVVRGYLRWLCLGHSIPPNYGMNGSVWTKDKDSKHSSWEGGESLSLSPLVGIVAGMEESTWAGPENLGKQFGLKSHVDGEQKQWNGWGLWGISRNRKKMRKAKSWAMYTWKYSRNTYYKFMGLNKISCHH